MHSRERSSPTISTGSNSGSDDESVSGRKRSSQLTRQVLEEYFKYSQEEAASRLGVSLSTLKRKFRSLKMGKRWPFQEAKQIERKRSLSFLLNQVEPTNAKRLDYRTANALAKAFADSLNNTRVE